MCDNGLSDMFEESTWDMNEVSDDCFKNFKVRPQQWLAELEYGGKNIDWATNIIFRYIIILYSNIYKVI